MTRIGIIIGLSLALTGCTKAAKEETRQPPPIFSDNGAAASQRISVSLQEPAVAAKLRNCLSQLKGQGLVGTSLTYRKSGSSWAFDDAKVTKATLPQGEDAAVQKCIQESARGTSFSVDSKEALETAASASFDDAGNVHVADIWNSVEELNAFADSALMPAFARNNIAPPSVSVYPTHKVLAYADIEKYRA